MLHSDLVRYCVEDHMGDKSTSAGEASIELASPAAVNYKSAHEAVFRAIEFKVVLPVIFGMPFLFFFLLFYVS